MVFCAVDKKTQKRLPSLFEAVLGRVAEPEKAGIGKIAHPFCSRLRHVAHLVGNFLARRRASSLARRLFWLGVGFLDHCGGATRSSRGFPAGI
jgi:hypothetical protein